MIVEESQMTPTTLVCAVLDQVHSALLLVLHVTSSQEALSS